MCIYLKYDLGLKRDYVKSNKAVFRTKGWSGHCHNFEKSVIELFFAFLCILPVSSNPEFIRLCIKNLKIRSLFEISQSSS